VAEAQSSSRAIVKLDGLGKTYPGGARALRDVTLQIRAGEFVTIIGRSGAGKSTLLRCLNRMIAPTTGRYLLRASDVTQATGRRLRLVRQHVGMIFQQFNLVGRLSVLQNVLAGRLRFMLFDWRNPQWRNLLWHPLSLNRIFPPSEQAAAMACLQELGIEQLAFRRADTLSGGQQQRVAIARVMAQQADLILADEPIASLDPRSAAQVMDGLRNVHENLGVPVLVNLHQVDIATKYGTRVIGMSHGRVVFDGPPDELTDAMVDRIYDGQPEYQDDESASKSISPAAEVRRAVPA
jgi:phosphonate transport system ATP-binding protein